MKPLRLAALSVPLVAAGAALWAVGSYRRGMADAEEAWRLVAWRAGPPMGTYDPEMVADLPEVARRYFNHAIAPGTRLMSAVELQMHGTFLLGDKRSHQTYSMHARQILRPPAEFVWIPQLKSGAMNITGSDALVGGRAWTRFWLAGLVPVAAAESSADLVRSASFRSAVEGIWAPASLLPHNGVRWEQIGPDRARLHFDRAAPPIILEISLSPAGAVREIVGQRWSNANPDKAFRLQPFGGTIEAERRFGGYTIPSRISAGNHFGTAEDLPFFQAEITQARYR
jgi:hypothetical protein